MTYFDEALVIDAINAAHVLDEDTVIEAISDMVTDDLAALANALEFVEKTCERVLLIRRGPPEGM